MIRQGCLGCLGFLALAIFVTVLVTLFEDRPEEASPGAIADPPRDTGRERRTDSLRAATLLDRASRLSDREAVELDSLLHLPWVPFTHNDPVHERAVSMRLDSATTCLRAADGGVRCLQEAREQLAGINDPRTPGQEKRQRALTAQADRVAAQQLATAEISARRAYARELETRFLDQGLDIEVTTRGAKATTLRREYVLAGRVFAHQLTKEEAIFTTLRRLGFKRLELTDGYDDAWYWTLD